MNKDDRLSAIEERLDKMERVIDAELKKEKEEKKGRWKPEEREKYWYFDDISYFWGLFSGTGESLTHFKRGNCYRTEEEAENRDELRRHIWEFEMPEIESAYLQLYSNFNWHQVDYGFDWVDKVDFEAGFILPITATEEDKEKRIDLLKKIYG